MVRIEEVIGDTTKDIERMKSSIIFSDYHNTNSEINLLNSYATVCCSEFHNQIDANSNNLECTGEHKKRQRCGTREHAATTNKRNQGKDGRKTRRFPSKECIHCHGKCCQQNNAWTLSQSETMDVTRQAMPMSGNNSKWGSGNEHHDNPRWRREKLYDMEGRRTKEWCQRHQTAKELAREARRLYSIPRGTVPVCWILACAEASVQSARWVVSRLPCPTAVTSGYCAADSAIYNMLQWVEDTMNSGQLSSTELRVAHCSKWRYLCGKLLSIATVPPSVLWDRWHSRQQRLYLEQLELTSPAEESERGVLRTCCDVTLDIVARVSTIMLGKCNGPIHKERLALSRPSLDTLEEEDGCMDLLDVEDESLVDVPLCEVHWGEQEEDDTQVDVPLCDAPWGEQPCESDEAASLQEASDDGKRKSDEVDRVNRTVKINELHNADETEERNEEEKMNDADEISKSSLTEDDNEDYACGDQSTNDCTDISIQKYREDNNNTLDLHIPRIHAGSRFTVIPSIAYQFQVAPGSPDSFTIASPDDPATSRSTLTPQSYHPWVHILRLYSNLFHMLFMVRLMMMTALRSELRKESSEQNGIMADTSGGPNDTKSLIKNYSKNANKNNQITKNYRRNKNIENIGNDTASELKISRNRNFEIFSDQNSKHKKKLKQSNPHSNKYSTKMQTKNMDKQECGKKKKNTKRYKENNSEFLEPSISDYEEEMWFELGSSFYEDNSQATNLTVENSKSNSQNHVQIEDEEMYYSCSSTDDNISACEFNCTQEYTVEKETDFKNEFSSNKETEKEGYDLKKEDITDIVEQVNEKVVSFSDNSRKYTLIDEKKDFDINKKCINYYSLYEVNETVENLGNEEENFVNDEKSTEQINQMIDAVQQLAIPVDCVFSNRTENTKESKVDTENINLESEWNTERENFVENCERQPRTSSSEDVSKIDCAESILVGSIDSNKLGRAADSEIPGLNVDDSSNKSKYCVDRGIQTEIFEQCDVLIKTQDCTQTRKENAEDKSENRRENIVDCNDLSKWSMPDNIAESEKEHTFTEEEGRNFIKVNVSENFIQTDDADVLVEVKENGEIKEDANKLSEVYENSFEENCEGKKLQNQAISNDCDATSQVKTFKCCDCKDKSTDIEMRNGVCDINEDFNCMNETVGVCGKEDSEILQNMKTNSNLFKDTTKIINRRHTFIINRTKPKNNEEINNCKSKYSQFNTSSTLLKDKNHKEQINYIARNKSLVQNRSQNSRSFLKMRSNTMDYQPIKLSKEITPATGGTKFRRKSENLTKASENKVTLVDNQKNKYSITKVSQTTVSSQSKNVFERLTESSVKTASPVTVRVKGRNVERTQNETFGSKSSPLTDKIENKQPIKFCSDKVLTLSGRFRSKTANKSRSSASPRRILNKSVGEQIKPSSIRKISPATDTSRSKSVDSRTGLTSGKKNPMVSKNAQDKAASLQEIDYVSSQSKTPTTANTISFKMAGRNVSNKNSSCATIENSKHASLRRSRSSASEVSTATTRSPRSPSLQTRGARIANHEVAPGAPSTKPMYSGRKMQWDTTAQENKKYEMNEDARPEDFLVHTNLSINEDARPEDFLVHTHLSGVKYTDVSFKRVSRSENSQVKINKKFNRHQIDIPWRSCCNNHREK